MTAATTARIEIVPVDPRRDAVEVRRWLAHPNSAFWGLGHLDADAVCDYLADVATHQHQDAWLGLVDGRAVFLVETYDPARVLLAGLHDARPGDLGMHVLVAPSDGAPRHGLTSAVFAAVMRFCLDAQGAERVVVEPDVRNARIRAKNAAAGFRELHELDVPDGDAVKRAMLSVCTRDDFLTSTLGRAAA